MNDLEKGKKKELNDLERVQRDLWTMFIILFIIAMVLGIGAIIKERIDPTGVPVVVQQG